MSVHIPANSRIAADAGAQMSVSVSPPDAEPNGNGVEDIARRTVSIADRDGVHPSDNSQQVRSQVSMKTGKHVDTGVSPSVSLKDASFVDSKSVIIKTQQTKEKKTELLQPTAVSTIPIMPATEGSIHENDTAAVGRRSPLNPLASPKMGRFRKGGGRKKAKDPRLNNNPIQGRLVVCISTTALLSFVFIYEMLYCYVSYNGRCVSRALYPIYTEPDVATRQPYLIRYGNGACEFNLDTTERSALGASSSDNGWPVSKVRLGGSLAVETSWDSPNPRVYLTLGGLDTNHIRNYGEVFRVFSAMYLHGGFIHILINISSQIQILWMIEPDWGFVRTALLFFVTGISGNLLSAVADPCQITVGSSGSMYGLLGALIPYCIEYWKTIPRPCCVLLFMIIIMIIGIVTGMWGFTDNYAHMGGALSGILYGFGTITTVAAIDKCTLAERMALTKPFSWCVSEKTENKLRARAELRKKRGEEKRKLVEMRKLKAGGKRGKAIQLAKGRLNEAGKPPCKVACREWVVRLTSIFSLTALWILLWLYLLREPLYRNTTPAGQLKFTGWQWCDCGEVSQLDRRADNIRGQWWCFTNQQDFKFYTGLPVEI